MTNNISFFNPKTNQMELGSLEDLTNACNEQLIKYYGVDLSELRIEKQNVEFTIRGRGAVKSTEYKEQLLRINSFLQKFIARPGAKELEDLKHGRILMPKLTKSEQEAVKRIMLVDYINEGLDQKSNIDASDAFALSVNRDIRNRLKPRRKHSKY